MTGTVKISALPNGSALGGSELIPMVQAGATVKNTPAAFRTYLLAGVAQNAVLAGPASGGAGAATYRAIVPTDLPLGTSVADPGTGTLNDLLPIQTVTGASKAFATADLFKKTRRSNSGSAMTDTLPASTAIGITNGTQLHITNVDATASDTITAGAGTTIAGNATYVLAPSRDISLSYDLANTAWRFIDNTSTMAIGPASATTGHVAVFADATGKVLAEVR